ncbi:MAG TPA: glycosyltransferase family 39 protein, partial [Thermoanaerobaculia bacterium]|nr:glycosyltransferase family 39 protein [Thermoanaerobaculia bacterium]
MAAGIALFTLAEPRFQILAAALLLMSVMLFAGPRVSRWWTAAPPLTRTAVGLEPETSPSRHTLPVLAALTAAAAALRLPGLDGDLWLDEIGTVVVYLRLPPLETLQTYVSANQHLLYSLAGSISFQLFGESAMAARLPAAILGIAGIPALYFLGRLIAPRREAWLAAALLTVSYHHVWFSQSARGYTGMILFTTLGTAFFLRAIIQDRARDYLMWVASMVAAILFMQNATFVLVAQVAAHALIALREQLPARRLFQVAWWASIAVLVAVAAHSLVIPQMIAFMRTVDRTGLGWSLDGIIPVLTSGLIAGVGVAGLVTILALALAGFISYWKRSPIFALIALFAPLANLAVLAITRYGAYPRFFLYVLPFALLIAVRGAFVIGEWLAAGLSLRRRWLPAFAILALLFISSIVSLVPNYIYPKQDYRGALAWVESTKGTGDMVAAAGLAATAYQVYHAPSLPVLYELTDLE